MSFLILSVWGKTGAQYSPPCLENSTEPTARCGKPVTSLPNLQPLHSAPSISFSRPPMTRLFWPTGCGQTRPEVCPRRVAAQVQVTTQTMNRIKNPQEMSERERETHTLRSRIGALCSVHSGQKDEYENDVL